MRARRRGIVLSHAGPGVTGEVDDGSAYLIFESRPVKGFYIAALSKDYLDVEREVCFIKSPLEGGALVRYEGLYYLIGSGLTGCKPYPNKYATSASLRGLGRSSGTLHPRRPTPTARSLR